MAKLAVADSFYLEGSTSALIQAAAAYQDWLTFFPTHPLGRPRFAENRRIGNASNRFARPRFDARPPRRTASESLASAISEFDFASRSSKSG
jgi:hypothetical protein